MRALVWDDKPEEYMDKLIEYLNKNDIFTHLETDVHEVLNKIASQTWDLVITDLLDERITGEDSQGNALGAEISSLAEKNNIPVYVVTGTNQVSDVASLSLDTPVFFKHSLESLVAISIVKDLNKRGLYSSRKKVFLIYGHDYNCDGAKQALIDELENKGIEVLTVTQSDVTGDIPRKLYEKMAKSRVILSLCTPDDSVHDKDGRFLYRQPRGNVLKEMGMALGRHPDVNKLIILQMWNEKDQQKQAVLPSDLKGHLNIRFTTHIESTFKALNEALLFKGVDIE